MICTKNLRFSSHPGAKVGRQGPQAVFSLNFSSAGKGPFMAGKAKKKHVCQKPTFLGDGGSGVRDMALTLL